MTTKERNEHIAKQGIKILLEKYSYQQSEILGKFQALGIECSKASLSNFSNGTRPVGAKTIGKIAEGIEKILKREKGLIFNNNQKEFIFQPNNPPLHPIAKISKNLIDDTTKVPKGYIIHEGRIDVPQKVELYKKATHEIIELGLRLRQFTNYFRAKRDTAYFDPIRQQLLNGINFKCYVLNPEGMKARRYFEDRAIVQFDEKATFEESPKIIADLKRVCRQINKEGYAGKMSLFQYDHFPYFHASIIDPQTENGLLYISPYLFGVRRANAPVIEVMQQQQKTLFKKYWRSIKAIIESPTVIQLV